MTLTFVMVCEAEADFRTASHLADRILCEAVDWIAPETLDAFRCWKGLDDSRPFVTWAQIADQATRAGVRPAGHFAGEPGALDAHATRRAIRYLQARKLTFDALFLIRDDDRKTARREGLDQARAESSLACPIVVGLAHVKRECWALAGFDPGNEAEQARLDALIRELSFDPRLQAERLATRQGERSAKRVLEILTGGDAEREADCWERAGLATLVDRGRATGLADYLEEVRTRIVPLL